MRLIRKEIYSRSGFAKKQCDIYFNKMKAVEKGGGNISICAMTQKFSQAKRIVDHYHKEFGMIMFPEIYECNNVH